jgi:glycosyltransferase involved in cell wall biosynthesis
MITLSESSRQEMVHDLGFREERVHVVAPGIDPHYRPGGERSPTPLVVAVGRLVPVKRFDLLVATLVALKADHPALEAVIVGEGYEREELEAQVREARAETWISLPGRIDEDHKVDLYRRAWVLASASAREGWGMTITEAAACGTPAVATDIAGHADAVVDGETGLLCRNADELRGALDRVLRDGDLRASMSAAALRNAERFTWEATARGTLEVLADAAIARRGLAGPR